MKSTQENEIIISQPDEILKDYLLRGYSVNQRLIEMSDSLDRRPPFTHRKSSLSSVRIYDDIISNIPKSQSMYIMELANKSND